MREIAWVVKRDQEYLGGFDTTPGLHVWWTPHLAEVHRFRDGLQALALAEQCGARAVRVRITEIEEAP